MKKDWLLLKNLKSTGMVNVESDLYYLLRAAINNGGVENINIGTIDINLDHSHLDELFTSPDNQTNKKLLFGIIQTTDEFKDKISF